MSSSTQFAWTDERVSKFRELFNSDHYYSFAAIAEAMSVDGQVLTKSAVAGKVHRLGLKRAERKEQVSVTLRSRKRLPPRRDEPRVAVTPSLNLDFTELTDDTCKFETNGFAPERFTFCGQPTVCGKPYCAAHCRLAYDPLPARRIHWKSAS